MAEMIKNQFVPDYAVHPGEILEEILEALGISKTEFANRSGLTPKTISWIITGKNPVTPENAIVFERILDISAETWNNLDSEYRLFQARQKAMKSLDKAVEWSKSFPLGELVKRGVLPKTRDAKEKAAALLNFFRVKDSDAWTALYGNMSVAYYKSATFSSNYKSVACWLRLSEIKAESIETVSYNADVFKNALLEIRTLTNESPQVFEPKIQKLCANSGVSLVFVSELPGTHLSGATRWITSNKAMIALSLRHKSNDHFWFTFYHEAGHILKHGKKDVYIDEKNGATTKQEQEAHKFSATSLISEIKYNDFIANCRKPTKRQVSHFARSIGIAPGIVVGRLQHDEIISYSWLNDLKVRFQLIENS
ncbi:HigA family addiction module antitoxin [Planctomycetota bacterium]